MIESALVNEAILTDLKGDKDAVIKTAVEALAGPLKLNAAEIVAAVMEREKIMSTGLGQGVALPHAKVKGLKKFALSICRTAEEVDYGAIDGQPVRIVALLLSPDGKTKEHVQMIAEVTKRLKFNYVRQAIVDAADARAIEKAFLHAG